MKWLLRVAGGGFLAQAITFIFYPFFTYKYSPESFKLLGDFSLAVSILSVLMGFRTDGLLNLVSIADIEETVQQAFSILFYAFIIFLIFAILLLVSLYDWQYILITLAALILNIYSIFLNVNVRFGDAGIISKSKVYQTMVSNFIIFLGSFINPSGNMLILAYIVNQGAGILGLYKIFNLQKIKLKLLGFEKVKDFLSEYRSDTAFLFRNALFNVILPYFLFIAYSFSGDIKSAGYTILGNQIIGIPQSIIRKSVSQYIVFRYDKEEKLVQFIIRIFIVSLLGWGIVYVAFQILIDSVLVFLGENWRSSGSVLRCVLLLSIIDYFFFITFQYTSIIRKHFLNSIIDYMRIILFILSLIFLKLYALPNTLIITTYIASLSIILSILCIFTMKEGRS